MLSAKQVAERGGETEFANSYAAYEAFSDDEKDRFGALRVVHSLEASQRRVTPRPVAGAGGAGGGPGPPTSIRWCGRTAAAASRWCSAHRRTTSSGWTSTRAGRCSQICSTAPPSGDLVYSHRWSVGDTVIWDNNGVLHRAAPYDPESPREMLRTTVLGDEPIQ